MKKLLITSLALFTSACLFGETWTFDDLTGWSGDTSKSSIVTAPAGMTGNALLMEGTNADQMSWMEWDTTLGSYTTPTVSFQFWMEDTDPANPSELFIRTNGWDDFVSIKEDDEATDAFVMEVRGGGSAFDPIAIGGIAFETVHEVELVYQPGNEIDIKLDGVLVDTSTGQAWDADASFGALSIRSQKATSYVDNLEIVPEPAAYAALFGLLALGFVAYRRRR